MHKVLRVLVPAVACAALASCATTLHLSEHAKDLRTRMTLRQAEGVLASYARPSATRGGACIMGNGATTQLDQEAPVRVSDFTLKAAEFALDARELREIRLLEASEVGKRCPNWKRGYAIVLKPERSVPDISLNASSRSEVDTILAALTMMSPQARLTTGYGVY